MRFKVWLSVTTLLLSIPSWALAAGNESGETPRSEIVKQVTARAAELGVTAAVPRLVELLYQRAALKLDIDRCSAAGAAAGACTKKTVELERLEGEFLRLTGLSMAEFKAGRRSGGDRTSPGSFRVKDLFLPGGSGRTDPYNCACSVSISSYNRWINRYWALECNNHGGHGFCSTDLDWAHTPGHGAMTGDIWLYFGDHVRYRECPDDHLTCFKGPMNGSWGNICNCDTVHSQFSNPFGSWYGGDLTDSQLVGQAGFSGLTIDGACDGQWLQVQEYIKENDPICCDDPMGTLVAVAQVAEGYTVTDVPVSVQNCNGGSQSGLYPNCGTFGATLRIAATCQTRYDDSWGSCSGRCGQILPDASCNCDFGCQQAGDCCSDYCNACLSSPDGPSMPCGPTSIGWDV
jgi:hypothetical protein